MISLALGLGIGLGGVGGPPPTGQPEITRVDFTGIDGAMLSNPGNPGKSFLIYAPGGFLYGIWFRGEGEETQPEVGASNYQQVSIGETDFDIALNLSNAINSFLGAYFSASNVDAVVTITAAANGSLQDALDVDTGAAITVTQQGT